MDQTTIIQTTDTPLQDDTSLTLWASLEDYISDWLASLDAAPQTVQAYRKGAGQFMTWAEYYGVTRTAVRDWRDSLTEEYSAATVNLWLSGLKSFTRWLHEEGYIDRDPAAAVKGIKRRGTTKHHKKDRLTDEEIRALFATCDGSDTDTRDYVIIALMAYAGLRTVEVSRANLDDLATKDGYPILWVQGKGSRDKDEFVKLSPPAAKSMAYWLQVRGDEPGPLFTTLGNRASGGRMTERNIRAAIVDKRYRAGGIMGKTKTIHSLRHSAGSKVIEKGGTPLHVQTLLRHANLSTSMIYVHQANRLKDAPEDYISYGEEN